MTGSTRKVWKATLFAALLAEPLAFAPQLHAQESGALEEVVVTAQRRAENLQDVPISVAAFNGEELKQAGVTALDQLGATVPGVDIFQFGQQTTTTITVRGVSQNDFADQNEAPVAVYEDGAYNSFIGGAGVNLFDTNRVEVLRGPQGTLFGRNATGGLVQIISNQPTNDFEAYGTADAGSFGLARFEGALSGPIGAGVTSRLAVSVTRQYGYDENTSGPRIGGARDLSTRLQFAFKPTDSVDVLLKLHSVRDNVTGVAGYKTSPSVFFPNVDNGLVHAPSNYQEFRNFCQGFFGATPAPGAQDCFGVVNSDPANPWQVSVNTPGLMSRTQYGATATVTWHMTSNIDLISISDYLRLRRDYLEDTDGTPALLFNFYSNMDSWQASQEFRLTGKNEDLVWHTGIYLLDIQHDILDGINANTGFSPATDFFTANTVRQGTNSVSVFGQADWTFAPKWTASLGARYIEDRKQMDVEASCQYGGCTTFGFNSPGIEQAVGFNEAVAPGLAHQSYGMVAAKAELEWRPVDGLMSYAGVSRGTKGGGFNAAALADIPVTAVPYKPETLLDYEAGVKTTFLGGRAQLNGGVFYYDYHNYQAYTLIGFTPYVFNAQAFNRGGELEARFAPARGLELALGVGIENAVVQNVPLQFGVGPYVDQSPPQSPKVTISGTIHKVWTLPDSSTLTLAGTVNHVGSRYFNTVNDPILSDNQYTTGNARLTYTLSGGQWDFGVWVNNLNNAQYVLTAFDLSTTDGVVSRIYAPPREFGGTVTYRFK